MKTLILLLIFSLVSGLSAKEKAAPLRSVCLLKSPSGSGSGFFTTFQGQDVLITNNHVILEMADVQIIDINGTKYDYDTVYASKIKDLAYIPLKRSNHADMPNLTVCATPDRLPVNTKVVAMGDSLGDGVIVETPGKYLGIGPDIIEVNAPFVPGNSGGPVITVSGHEVIGVATYCRIITRRWGAETGSRFEAGRYRPSVRRFATRIDQLKPEDFQQVGKPEIRQDLMTAREIFRTCNQIMNLAVNNRDSADTVLQILDQHTQWRMPSAWNTQYMQKETRKKLNWLITLRNMLMPQNSPVESVATENEKIQACWRQSASRSRIFTRKAVVKKCLVCNGSGKIREEIPLSQRNPRKLQELFHTIPCAACQQRGTVQFGRNEKYAFAADDFGSRLTGIITPETKQFCDLTIGAKLMMLPPFYKMQQTQISRTGVFTVYRYQSNHCIRTAAETRLWFIGNLLMRMDILFPMDGKLQEDEIRNDAESNYSGLPNAVLEIRKKRMAPIYKKPFPTADLCDAAENERTGRHSLQPDPRIQRAAAVLAIRQIQKAAQEDPFGIFYSVQVGNPQNTLHSSAEFLQVSLQHAEFQTCRELLREEPRKSMFSGRK